MVDLRDVLTRGETQALFMSMLANGSVHEAALSGEERAAFGVLVRVGWLERGGSGRFYLSDAGREAVLSAEAAAKAAELISLVSTLAWK